MSQREAHAGLPGRPRPSRVHSHVLHDWKHAIASRRLLHMVCLLKTVKTGYQISACSAFHQLFPLAQGAQGVAEHFLAVLTCLAKLLLVLWLDS